MWTEDVNVEHVTDVALVLFEKLPDQRHTRVGDHQVYVANGCSRRIDRLQRYPLAETLLQGGRRLGTAYASDNSLCAGVREDLDERKANPAVSACDQRSQPRACRQERSQTDAPVRQKR